MLQRESPNSRLNAIRKFLGQAPPGSTRLRLLVQDTPPLPIGEWMPVTNQDAREPLAEEIDELCLQTAAEKGRRYRQQFLLAWVDDAGGMKTVRELSVYGHQLPMSDTPEDSVRELDGSSQSQLAQTQRHLEAMMRMHIQWEDRALCTLASTVDRLSERCAQMEQSNARKHDEVLEAKETILGLVNESAAEQLTPAQIEAFNLLKQIVPTAMVWMQAQAANAAAKKSSNGKPNGKPNGDGKAAA